MARSEGSGSNIPKKIRDSAGNIFNIGSLTDTELLQVSGSSITSSPGGGNASIKTGTYTGDGTTSQAITGIGFRPKYVRIWRSRTGNAQNTTTFETTDGLVDNNVDGIAINLPASLTTTNAIISLDVNGFTVDDGSPTSHPNQIGVVYEFLAIG